MKKIIKSFIYHLVRAREKRIHLSFIKKQNYIDLHNNNLTRKINKKGFTSTEYVLYNLKNKDNLNQYANEFVRWKSRDINGSYKILFDDKKLCFNLFDVFDIMHPQIFLIKKYGLFYSYKNEKIPLEEALSKICNKNFFFKPILSAGGHGAVSYEAGMDLKTFLSNCGDGIFEEKISNNKFFNKFYPDSLNTIRLVTINDNNSFMLTNAVFRMGTKKSKCVDNASSGGVFSEIDLESGRLSKAASYFVEERFDKHPDTKETIFNVEIPNWNSIKEFVIKNHKKLNFMKLIAWDLAFTENGIYVVECNASTDFAILQMNHSIKDDILYNFIKVNLGEKL